MIEVYVHQHPGSLVSQEPWEYKSNYPCDKTDCRRFAEWRIAILPETAKGSSPEEPYGFCNPVKAPKGASDCWVCKYFQPMDLYSKELDKCQ